MKYPPRITEKLELSIGYWIALTEWANQEMQLPTLIIPSQKKRLTREEFLKKLSWFLDEAYHSNYGYWLRKNLRSEKK